MITAQQPWSIELVPSLGTTATRLKNSSGNVIALFNRYEDAEFVINELIAQAENDNTIANLEDRIADLEDTITQLKQEAIKCLQTVDADHANVVKETLAKFK